VQPEPKVQIVEVGPRDGLQNEATSVATANKVAFIERLIDCGVRRIEVASFVHPGKVPQMADAEDVVAALPDRRDVSFIGLCLNKRGVLRALATREGGRRGVDEIGAVAVASDAFGIRNQGQTRAETIAETRAMIALAKAEGMNAQATIAAAFGCPFEGEVAHDRVLDMAEELAGAGAEEIALADTIGVAVPAQVADLFGAVAQRLPQGFALRAHFHDTRNTGIANAWAAYRAGVRTLDASLGGLGGCPFAPGATGNIATEDLVYLLDRSNVAHGLDLDRLAQVNAWMAGVIGKDLPSLVARAHRARADLDSAKAMG
jgi:hydroxymethylglutaryl-CoA lyase